MKSTAYVAIVLLAFSALTACESGSEGSMPDDIEARAQARWDALTGGDVETAYQYLSPGYRSSISLDTYRLRLLNQRVRWTGGEVTGSSCGESACTVDVAISYEIKRPFEGLDEVTSTRQSTEDWVRADNQWWYLPDN